MKTMNKFLIKIGDNYLVNFKYRWSECDEITYIDGYYVSPKIHDAKSFNREQLDLFFLEDYYVGPELTHILHVEGWLVHPSYIGVTRHKDNCDNFELVTQCPLCYGNGIVTEWVEEGVLGNSICGKCKGNGLIGDHGRPYHVDSDIQDKLSSYNNDDSYEFDDGIIKIIVK